LELLELLELRFRKICCVNLKLKFAYFFLKDYRVIIFQTLTKVDKMGFVDELKKYRLQFIRAKQNENLSVHTIRHYETGFRYFFEYVDLLNKKKRGKLISSHIDENFIYDFLDWVAQKNGKQSQPTKKAYLVRISVFLRYVSKKSGAKFDFRMALEDVRIKIPKRERKSLTPEKRKRLYE